ncbi:unnamed protein product [Spirodela intermedia]|uniref:Uncharacterized protein n=1 Tax=Spirodela intermedia TaxID=51605 RepID=A0A7I8JE11_SPIIN|nr:unnamed protein product [Spirodela intermedia]CAA6668394.1 unnamed protein product [Spirodela intermedia]
MDSSCRGSRTSPRSHVSVRVRCYAAGSPAEAGTTVKRESSETEGTALEVESGVDAERDGAEISVGIGSPSLPVQLRSFKMSHGDQAFFVLAFIACTTSVAFTSLVIAAIPTLCAIKRAAISLAKLADTARVELPSTMAAIRLSGMEISDLTLELSDLSQEIADGVNKSAQAVQAAEAGIRKIGHLARHQTMTIIQERASLPDISLQPMVEGAAKNTSHAIKQVRKTFLNIISRGEDISDRVDD